MLKKKGNSLDFSDVVHNGVDQYQVDKHKETSTDLVIEYYHDNRHYRANYRDAINQYYKACGCRVYRVGFVQVEVSKPTKVVDPIRWYEHEYRPKIYLSSELKYGLFIIFILVFLFVCSFVSHGGIH